jgi:hypothetical protein
MTRTEARKDLEERGKIILRREIMDRKGETKVCFKIKNMEDDVPVLNFMNKEGYILPKGDYVSEFFYEITNYGRRWALS